MGNLLCGTKKARNRSSNDAYNEFKPYIVRQYEASNRMLTSRDAKITHKQSPIYKLTISPRNCNYVTPSNEGYDNRKSQYNLKPYKPSYEVRKFFNANFKHTKPILISSYYLVKLTHELENQPYQLTEQNYLDALKLFADVEDLYCEVAIKAYNRESQQIEQCEVARRTPKKYRIFIPHINESRPPISVYGRIMIVPEMQPKNEKVFGKIIDIQEECITVEFEDKIDTDLYYDVNFLSNRTTFRKEKLAIELMRLKNLVRFMFPKRTKIDWSNVTERAEQSFTWFNQSVANNAEQRIAIENMYNGTSYPYPYILFGPPGTGKTATLVECILQIWANKQDAHILVVSTSNYSCNVISERLLDFLPESQIFRLFSKSQEEFVDKIEPEVLEVSNLKTKVHYIPNLSELYSYRIVIATPNASGLLIQDDFSTGFFSHLFIDECGSSTEGSSLIPIAGLVSTQNTIKANIVLAGDPLQLRPVIYSKYAENLGYGVSMIERLMEFPLYKKDDNIGDYNNKFITKLRNNYRSHSAILHVSNQLFYQNELKACGSADVTDWILQWKYLPNPNFPIIFESVFGEASTEDQSPSLYSTHEIKVVMSYLKVLVNSNINGKLVQQSDIGVITPYRKQNQKIRAQCNYCKLLDIEVALVEAFQGKEKSIIIVSTVRSNIETQVVFNSERLLNVALTRAQALLIIIGNPKVFVNDKYWCQLIKFCSEYNAIRAKPFDSVIKF